MTGIKRIMALITSVSLVFPLFNTQLINAEKTDTVKIMSIGDSITDGYGTDGSYRKFLYNNLENAGFSIDMTGPNWSWGDAEFSDSDTGETFSYDAAHCGYSGYAIQEYNGRNGILETVKSGDYLSVYSPDIVILQIGTNDVIDNHEIDNAGSRLDTLVTYILENIPESSALFVTTIPDLEPNRSDVYAWFANYRHSADWSQEYSDEEAAAMVKQQTDNYNTQVKNLIAEKQASGVKNIYLGDINSVVDNVESQLKDGVHPNDTGYRLMGNYWTEKISAYLRNESIETPANPEYLTGDINSDGIVNSKDALMLQKYFLTGKAVTDVKAADIDKDGNINIADMVMLKNMLLSDVVK